jgi:hypothetical protein
VTQPPGSDSGGQDDSPGDREEVHRRPRRSRPKEPPASGVRRRAGPRRSSTAGTTRSRQPVSKQATQKPPAQPGTTAEKPVEPMLQGHRGAVIPLRAARATAGGSAATEPPAPQEVEARAPERPVTPTPTPTATGDDIRAAAGIPRPTRRPYARRRGGIRAVFGPERVAAVLVVILLAVAVPVTLGVTVNRGGRQQPPPSVAVSVPPSAPVVTPSAPPRSVAPTGSVTPSATPMSPAERQAISNLVAVHGDLFADGSDLQAELARADGGRSEFLYGLLADPLRHAATASGMDRPPSIGDLGFLLQDAYTRIRGAAAIGRNACAACRPEQLEAAKQTIQAIQALRPLNDQLRELLGLGPTPS